MEKRAALDPCQNVTGKSRSFRRPQLQVMLGSQSETADVMLVRAQYDTQLRRDFAAVLHHVLHNRVLCER